MVDIVNSTHDRSMLFPEVQYNLPASFLRSVLDKCDTQKMSSDECRTFGENELQKYVDEHRLKILGLSGWVIGGSILLALIILVGVGLSIYCLIQKRKKVPAGSDSSKGSKELPVKSKPIKSAISGLKSTKVNSKIGSKSGSHKKSKISSRMSEKSAK